MKKYFIAFGLFCLSLFLINDVYAADLSLTGYDSLINASLWNCSGSNTCSTSVSNSTNLYGNYLVYTSGSELTIGANGIFWAIQSPVSFSANYLYSVSALVCYNTKANNTFQFLTGESGNLDAFEYPSYSKVYDNWSPNDYIYLSDGGYSSLTLKTCRNVSGFINPSKMGNFLGLRLRNYNGVLSAQYVWLLGLKVESLGVDSSALRSVLEDSISSSGLAKASDVNEVKKAQEQIKTELKNTQQSIDKQTEQQNKNHKETMDYMKDESDIDTSKVDNLVGYLPAGPLDSIINLPLSLLNAISSNLGKTCVAPTFKVPFVNENFTLPCVSTLYEKMGATTLLNSLGGIAAAVMLYKYFVYLYNWIDSVLSLKGNKLKGWGE